MEINNQIQSQKSDFPAASAYALAESSGAYLSLAETSPVQYIGATGIWKFNLNTCSANLTSVNVVFSLTSSAGANENLYVAVNPTATKILGSTLQPSVDAAVSNNTSWSGYEYYVSTGVNYVEANWNLPSVSAPSTGCNLNVGSKYYCILVDWTGASVSAGGYNGFAQGGSGSSVDCSASTCGSYYTAYFAWYEFPGLSCNLIGCGSPLYNCTALNSLSVAVGDDIEEYEDYTPSNSTMNVYVDDLTMGNACTNLIFNTTKGAPTMNQPYYAQFIAERPEQGYTSYYSLPDFQTTTFSVAYVDGSQINSLSPSTTYNMVNSNNININLGSVSYNRYIGAYFDETWSTSAGT